MRSFSADSSINYLHGQGRATFRRAAWEDLPTMFTIVNTFADLEVREWRGASVVKTVGAKDLRDQRILE